MGKTWILAKFIAHLVDGDEADDRAVNDGEALLVMKLTMMV